VDAGAAQRVEVGGQRGDEGLALAGAHLGDAAAVQHDAADELDVVVALAQGALGGLPHRGEGLGNQVVEGLPVLDALAEVRGARPQLGIGAGGQLGTERIDPLHEGDDALDDAVVVASEDLLERVGHGWSGALPGAGGPASVRKPLQAGKPAAALRISAEAASGGGVRQSRM
jgi:hypothetical protein